MAFLHKGLVYFEGEFHTCWNVIHIPMAYKYLCLQNIVSSSLKIRLSLRFKSILYPAGNLENYNISLFISLNEIPEKLHYSKK